MYYAFISKDDVASKAHEFLHQLKPRFSLRNVSVRSPTRLPTHVADSQWKRSDGNSSK